MKRKISLCFDIIFVYDRSQVDVFLKKKKIDFLVTEEEWYMYIFKFEKKKWVGGGGVMFSISLSSIVDRSFMLNSF